MFFDNELSLDIWNKKYRFRGESEEEWFDRISGGNEEIKDLMKQRKFLFGGRILANRGLDKYGLKVTLSNCYVTNRPQDDLESIYDVAGKMARTYSYGGGDGVDISSLSPRGAKINNAAKETSGSISFAEIFDLTTKKIGMNLSLIHI